MPPLLAKLGAWRGMTAQTPVGEGDGRLAAIKNGYVSPDGQAIRRWPGYKCVVDLESSGGWETEFIASQRDLIQHPVSMRLVRPHCFMQVRGRLLFLGESDFQKQIVRRPDNSVARVLDYNGPAAQVRMDTLIQTYGQGNGAGVAGNDGFGTPGDYLWFTGTGSLLDGRFWRIATIVYGAPTVITLTTTWVGAGVPPVPNVSAAYRVRAAATAVNGGLTSVNDPDGFALWTLPRLPNVTTPSGYLDNPQCLPSVAASRNWDYGASALAVNGFTEGMAGISRRKATTPWWRANPDVAGNRALAALPEAGVVWQAPLITVPGGSWLPAPDLPNGINDQLRSLGVPKAVMLDPAAKTLANGFLFAPGAGQQALPAGTYRFRVAYKDDSTGEIGLASEEVSYTTTGGEFCRLWVMHPGYLLGETAATSIVVYMSLAGGTALGLWKTFTISLYGTAPKGNASLGLVGRYQDLAVVLDVLIPTAYGRNLVAADIDFTRAPDPLKQMPMGARCVRTVRGTSFYGGRVGDAGDERHIEAGTATARFELPDTSLDRNGRNRDEIAERLMGVDAVTLDGGFGVGAGVIPPAYAGVDIRSVGTLLAEYGQSVRLSRQINSYAFEAGGAVLQAPWWYMQRWLLGEKVHTLDINVAGQPVQLVLPRGLYQWGEVANPGVCPASNREYVDAERSEDIEAMGRYGNSLILCTREQAHVLSWGVSPSGNRPSLISTQFGCIAPNSMVEFDGGVAWISDRGPVALTGGSVNWIGADVSPMFTGREARYLRDSRGRMKHCWAAHDPARRLVLFGMVTAAITHTLRVENNQTATVVWNLANDAQRSKFPCDEVLVWSYATGAWSTWRPHQPIHWMSEIVCSDGQARMAFWSSDRRLYALDDAWGAGGDRFGAVAATTPELDQTLFTGAAASFSAIPGVANNLVQAGMEFLIYSPTERRVRGSGTITAYVSPTQVVLSTPLTWYVGDILVWGWQTLEVQTNFEAPDLAEKTSSGEYLARYSLHTAATASGSYPGGSQGPESLAWCELAVQSEDRTFAIDNAELGRDGAVHFRPDRLLQPGTTAPVAAGHHTTVGRAVAFNSKLIARFRGAAQVRLHQLGRSVE